MKMPSSPSLEKLSRLQRLILVVLLEKGCSRLSRPTFRSLVKKLYWGERHAPSQKEVVAKSLSRALARLEGRGYIVRTGKGWQLSCSDLVNNGLVFAILAWQRAPGAYALLGLHGPDAESLGLKATGVPKPKTKGVEIQLHFP